MVQQVLIVYYSWSHTTERLAQQLQKITRSPMLALTVAPGTFSDSMDQTSTIAKHQIATKQLPRLTNALPALTDHETILVGSPVWSGIPATPVLSFLQQLPQKDLRLAPFYTYYSDASNYEAAFKNAANHFTVTQGLGIAEINQVPPTTAQINQWVQTIIN